MTKFQRTVRRLAEFYSMPEQQVAMVLLDLFASGCFDWRRL